MSEENAGEFSEMLDSLPDDLKSNEYLMGHKSFESVAKSLVHNHKMSGRDKIVIPKEGDADEVFDNYRKALNIPSSMDDYSAGKMGEAIDSEIVEGLRKTAFESQISKDAWDKMSEAIAGSEYARVEAQRARNKEAFESLKKELGDDFEARQLLAEKAAKHVFGENAKDITDQRLSTGERVGNNPDFIKALSALGEQIGEGKLAEEGGEAPGKMSKDEARKELNALWGDPDKKKALVDDTHPQHGDMIELKTKLNAIIHAED